MRIQCKRESAPKQSAGANTLGNYRVSGPRVARIRLWPMNWPNRATKAN